MSDRYPVLRWFRFDHLPGHLRPISQQFADLAYDLAAQLPHDQETSTALRKLLEAKDAAVRAAVHGTEIMEQDARS